MQCKDPLLLIHRTRLRLALSWAVLGQLGFWVFLSCVNVERLLFVEARSGPGLACNYAQSGPRAACLTLCASRANEQVPEHSCVYSWGSCPHPQKVALRTGAGLG